MAVKKNADGGHYVSILLQPDRRKRTRYEKIPLVPPRNPLLGFIADMFRGGPNPFLGSPIATAIDRRSKIEKQARLAASGDAGMASALTVQIETALDRYLRGSVDDADAVLDELDRHTDEEQDFLENTRPSAIRANLEVELDKVENDVNSELGPAATRLAKARTTLEHFIDDHGVARTLWWGRPLTRHSVYLVLGVTLFEFVLNTAFFSGSQRSGIVGGSALAMLLSITTIVLGVAFGIAYQFSHPKSEGKGWIGKLGLGVLVAATVFYLLLLTLARLAGESGDLHMFATAAKEIQIRPFSGLLDLPALAYFFFSIAVIAGVFVKFIDTMGHFPRIRSHKLAVQAAEDEVEDIQAGMLEHARTVTDDAIRAVDAAPSIIQATLRAIKDLLMSYENVADQFKNNVKDIKDAEKLLVRIVRRHVSDSNLTLEDNLDYVSPVQQIETRLAAYRTRASKLLEWEEISPAKVDRCREEMAALGKRKAEEIESKCVEIRNDRYKEMSGKRVYPERSPTQFDSDPLPAGAGE